MSVRPLILLVGSCFVAFLLAAYTLSAGAGFLAAFMAYSFGGSATLVLFSALSFLKFEQQEAQLASADAHGFQSA